MDVISVIDGGLQTTVQDLGRYGFQRYGVPVSGAADQYALRAANVLVGNDQAAAGLEITLVGPRLEFLTSTVFALTGADLSPLLDGAPVATWQPVVVSAGAVLSFGEAREGVRAYLAVAGGIDVPLVLRSRSTHVRSKLGGVDGRAARAGDRLKGLSDAPPERVDARRIPASDVPRYGHDHALRVVLGPQDGAFTKRGLDTLLGSAYTVSSQSDRIGYRLQGPAIEHATSPDIVSDGIPNGAVQVAGDGMPIVLLVDRGTTGGYTKIATIISVDLPRLAQAATGDTVRFAAVTVDDAHALLREQEDRLRRLAVGPIVRFARERFQATVDGVPCDVVGDLAEVPGVPIEAAGRHPPIRTTVRVTGESLTRTYDVTIDESR